jgi:S-adenosyl methyltransferase
VSVTDPDMPASVNPDIPNAARVYDYFLGGVNNFAADREFAERMLTIAPHVPQVCQLNRTFLRRAVRYMLDQGIRQFLDLGSGIPDVGMTHQVAERAGVPVQVVYVDREPVAYLPRQQHAAGRPDRGDRAGRHAPH